MEHQQSPPQIITAPLTSEDENKKTKAQIEQKKLADSYFLRKLIQRHPRLVLLGVSIFLFIAIYSSIVSIFQVNVLKEETGSIPVATTNYPNTPPASTDNSLPLWLLGTIILGGAVGGVAIAKRLSNSSALSQFFSRFQFHQPQQQFPSSRQSILSLPALKLSEPKPTWAESSIETESNLTIYSEDEFVIFLEEDSLEDGEEIFLEAVELTAEEENLIIENIAFPDTSESLQQMRSPVEHSPTTPEIASNSVPENEVFSPHSRSLAEILDLRQKLSLATLLEIDK